VVGGKTGYIDAAGYCLAAVVNDSNLGPLAVVVLGARSNSARFSEIGRLADWASENGESLSSPQALKLN
jgi:D-alanyl-D-alanine carboxypeptidase